MPIVEKTVSPEAEGLILRRFMQLNKPEPVGKYQTYPHHPFDKLLWRPLRPLMLLRASGKVTHWWHWHDLPKEVDITEKGTELEGNPKSFSTLTGNRVMRRLKNIAMSLGGWQEAYIIGPQEESAYTEGWRYAYDIKTKKGRERRYSAVISHSPVTILAGPDKFTVAGLKPNSFEQIPLHAVGKFPRRGRLPIF